ncbi:MAG: helicase-exonuclease AddAB subunit AddA [Clostridia bacterium]|nr:helicase-exonuclease AddAB subunit AddA [Clostridia bacterium]
MAEIKLTKAQQTAVDDRSGTLLVAAAAGSGKTAILTKRLISRLCSENEEGDISEFLVVTFTKAATGELRARLYKELSEFVSKNPANRRARRQLSLIGLAKISTIHSFCLDIIKSNFEALSLPSVLRMGEETEVNVLLKATLDRIISERYEKAPDGSVFHRTVEILSGARNDNNLSDSLLKLYRKLRGLSDPQKKLASYIDKYREVQDCDEIFGTYFGELIKNDISYELDKAVADLECVDTRAELEPDAYTVLHDAILHDIESIKSVKAALSEGYTATRNAASTFKAATCKRKPKECDCSDYIDSLKDIRSDSNKKVSAMFTKYLGADECIVKQAARESREVLEEIYSLLTELDSEFSRRKLEQGILDFSDLEQYTLKLLVEDTGEFSGEFRRTALAEVISANYKEIYIDEYQDTNDVQDMIFRAVSTYDKEKGTETNRFLVGDVKQSIYRFRGAQPEIFSSYIRMFSDVGGDVNGEFTTHKLYLSNNFRCSENVIRSTNQVFFRIMDDYTEDDSLIYSKHETTKVNAPTELVVLNSVPDEEAATEETLPDEAFYIASRIREMAYNPEYRNEKGEMYRYSDFAVLERSANSLSDPFRRAFRKMRVPFTSDTPEDFFKLPEVLLAMCLFNCVDNPQRDIYTAGLMYSPLFGFTADDLAIIRCTDRKTSFFGSVSLYAENAEDGELKDKVCAFLETLSRFRSRSRGTPTDILVAEMFEELGMYDIYNSSPEKRKNVRKLYEMARTFEKTSFRGLSAILDYLVDLSQGDSGSRPDAKTDSVKFMSIHRSKGLEFPVVFVGGLMREFNLADEREPIIFSSKYGIGVKLRDTEDSGITETRRNFSSINTPFREAIRGGERALMLEEEKRLLYVAMTRARDRLILVANTKDKEKTFGNAGIRREGGFESYGKYAMCYFDFLYHALTDKEFSDMQKAEAEVYDGAFKCFTADVSNSILKKKAAKDEAERKAPELDSTKIDAYSRAISEAKKNGHYSSALSKISAKLSVSRLKKGLLDEEQTLGMKVTVKKKPSFMLDKAEADAAEKGTAAHTFMQFADFDRLSEKGSQSEADRLLSLGFITARMHRILDTEPLDAFVGSKLFGMMKNAPKLYRERRFNLKLPASEFTEKYDERLKDEFILVQGVSDLYFENPDGTLTLVDFKTDNVREADGEEILRNRHTEQLRYYKRAVEEITAKTVSKVYLYSFALSREVEIKI